MSEEREDHEVAAHTANTPNTPNTANTANTTIRAIRSREHLRDVFGNTSEMFLEMFCYEVVASNKRKSSLLYCLCPPAHAARTHFRRRAESEEKREGEKLKN